MSEPQDTYENIRLVRNRGFVLSLEQQDQAGIASRVLDALIRFIKRFISDINSGAAGLSITLGRLHSRALKLDTESRTSSRTNKSGEFDITTRVQNLCINYRPVSDPQQLLLVTKTNDAIIKGYYRYQNVELPQAIPSLVTIDPRSKESVISVVELLAPLAPVNKARSLNFQGDNSSSYSPGLFGNLRLVTTSKNSTGDVVENIAGQEWLLLPMSDNPKPTPFKINYKVFAKTIERSILRQVTSTITDIEANFGIVSRNRRATRVDDLIRYLERLRNGIVTGQYDDEALDRANQIILMLDAYVHWMANPYYDLLNLYTRNTMALLNVCEANN